MNTICLECKKLTGGLCEKCLLKQDNSMNKSNQIKDIVKEIQRVVPSIMELKFGCKIKVSWGNLIITGKRFEGYYIVSFDGQVLTDTFIREERIVEILGRDITLQDLLLVIGKKKNFSMSLLNERIAWVTTDFRDNVDTNGFAYDLTKSFLENLENDEFRTFIFNLICK